MQKEVQKLSDRELVEETRDSACKERALTEYVLKCLDEVERRSLHLQRGSGSISAWACSELKYTEDQAQYRVDAMRALRDVPEVQDKLDSGRLSLTHLVKAQRFFRQERRLGNDYSYEKKKDLFEKIEGRSTRECDRILAELSSEPVPVDEGARPVSGGRTRFTFVVGQEVTHQVDQLKIWWGGISYLNSFERAIDEAYRRHIPDQNITVAQRTVGSKEKGVQASVADTRYIQQSVRKMVWRRDQSQCAFVSSETGRRCGSTHALEIDHIVPFALGGSRDPDNLRLACRAHNLWLARQTFGSKVPPCNMPS